MKHHLPLALTLVSALDGVVVVMDRVVGVAAVLGGVVGVATVLGCVAFPFTISLGVVATLCWSGWGVLVARALARALVILCWSGWGGSLSLQLLPSSSLSSVVILVLAPYTVSIDLSRLRASWLSIYASLYL